LLVSSISEQCARKKFTLQANIFYHAFFLLMILNLALRHAFKNKHAIIMQYTHHPYLEADSSPEFLCVSAFPYQKLQHPPGELSESSL
jgi:hypothetical protein